MNKASREIISVDEALRRVLAAAPGPRADDVPIDRALGRILATAVGCAEDVPTADHSAMDGFGVRHADLKRGARLRLAGDSLAGRPFAGRVAAGECARVMTGGLIPQGADTVVPVELTSGYEAAGGRIEFHEAVELGANIRRRGTVRRAGDPLLRAGERIRAGHVGVLAQQGYVSVPVGARPRVAVLPTGDEIVEVGEMPGPGQVRNSNAYALAAQVEAAGGVPERLPILRDRAGATTETLAAALDGHDLVCTIGGVSMGTHDLVRAAFAELGGRVLVESIHVKPGKPTLFGSVERGGSRRFLLGLPGNPASAFTIFALFGAPWLRAFQGVDRDQLTTRLRARLAGSRVGVNRRTQALPARIEHGVAGTRAHALEQRTSADLFSLAAAEALFLVPAGEAAADGDPVDWLELP